MTVVRALTAFLILGLSAGLLLTSSESSTGDATTLLYVVGLIVLIVLMSVFPRLRGIGPLAVVMILAVTGYAYRFELQGVVQHVLGALMPYRGEQVGEGSVSFAAWPDGQFRIDAMANGTPVTFLVDTGATDVVLTPRDAERLGYDLRNLDFTESYTTANGGVMGAPIVLHEVAIGPIPDV